MGIFLANPWGLLALAALPAIVVVHCLQERSRRVRASTLFLLERAAPTAAAGARIEKFRQSLPFWMQLLAAAITAWLLADPRLVRRDSRQTVAVVLDSSASMQACRDQTLAALARRLPAWNAVAGRTDWHLLETGPRRPPLYAGTSLSELLETAGREWRPTAGTHDATPALSIAASLAPAGTGAVILVSDQPQPVPEGVGILSAGGAFDNVGFSGGDVRDVDGRRTWRALVTNHGATPQTRSVSLWLSGTGASGAGAIGAPEPVTLPPGRSHSLQGAWPDGAERLTLRLSPDRFAADDVLPLVRPMPRTVGLARSCDGPAGELIARMALATGGVASVAAAEADVVVDRVNAEPDRDAILLSVAAADASGSTDAPRPPTYDAAWISPEDHPLVKDLAWGGLLSGPAGGLALRSADEPLLWKGRQPLVFLRRTTLPGGRMVEALVLNFDVERSNAGRTPALLVMISRFLDRVRSRIDRAWVANVDAGQMLDPVGSAADAALTLAVEPVIGSGTAAGSTTTTTTTETTPFVGRAPEVPAFFAVTRTGSAAPLASGAARFADARESDFRAAAPADTLDTLRREAALKQSIEDPWTPLWLGGLAAALAVAWVAGSRPGTR